MSNFPSAGAEVIQVPETGLGSAAAAAGMLDASLDYLAAPTASGTQAHGEMLAHLQRAQAQVTAVNAAVLAAFTAQSGYEPDWVPGRRSTVPKMSRGAAAARLAAAAGPARRDRRRDGHPEDLRVLGKDIATGTDPLPPLERDQADEMALEAAGCRWRPEAQARSIWETWKAQHPDPDDGNGEPGDEDGFGRLRLVSPSAAPGLSGTWPPGARPSCRRSSTRWASTWALMTGAAWSSGSMMRWMRRCRG